MTEHDKGRHSTDNALERQYVLDNTPEHTSHITRPALAMRVVCISRNHMNN